MKKQCAVYGNKNEMEFKFRFIFSESDYLETLCEELNKNNGRCYKIIY